MNGAERKQNWRFGKFCKKCVTCGNFPPPVQKNCGAQDRVNHPDAIFLDAISDVSVVEVIYIIASLVTIIKYARTYLPNRQIQLEKYKTLRLKFF